MVLTEEQKQQYRCERRCFKCGHVGHRANECRSKNKVSRVEEQSEKEALVAKIQELSEEDRATLLADFL